MLKNSGIGKYLFIIVIYKYISFYFTGHKESIWHETMICFFNDTVSIFGFKVKQQITTKNNIKIPVYTYGRTITILR